MTRLILFFFIVLPMSLHAQTDSLQFFRNLYHDPQLETIDSLLGIPDTRATSGIEYRNYRQVAKMDDPKYLFECHVIRGNGQTWTGWVYNMVYTSSKTAPIRRYQKEFAVAKGIDSLKTAIEKAMLAKPQKEVNAGYLSSPPAIYYRLENKVHLLVPRSAWVDYTRDPQTHITRLTYKSYNRLVQLFNRMTQ